jgi:hypothetical protein
MDVAIADCVDFAGFLKADPGKSNWFGKAAALAVGSELKVCQFHWELCTICCIVNLEPCYIVF